MSNPLSVVIITKNEQHFIADAVKSSLFADEVLVMDSGSSDNTCAIAKGLGAKVIHQDWLGFGAQKNKAVSMSKNDWVFVLDADERITKDLQKELLITLNSPKSKAYYVPRINRFFGKDIKHCGLYPDYSIRLFHRRFGSFNEVSVHESVQISESVENLISPMKHIAFDSVIEFRNKQKHYAILSQKKPNLIKAFVSPVWVFLKIYLFRLGMLEGWRGLVIAIVYAEYTFWKYFR